VPPSINTPSRVPPTEPAPLARRLGALGYDLLVLAAVLMCFTLIVVLIRGLRPIDPGTWWFEACLLGISVLFYGWFWTHGGQTLGMRAWRIRIVGRDCEQIGWDRAVGRFFAAWLSALPAGAGYWWSLFDPQRRCWHDRLSRTVLVRVTAKTR
jgi:uncharacterized RDD family membrane protein YckC